MKLAALSTAKTEYDINPKFGFKKESKDGAKPQETKKARKEHEKARKRHEKSTKKA